MEGGFEEEEASSRGKLGVLYWFRVVEKRLRARLPYCGVRYPSSVHVGSLRVRHTVKRQKKPKTRWDKRHATAAAAVFVSPNDVVNSFISPLQPDFNSTEKPSYSRVSSNHARSPIPLAIQALCLMQRRRRTIPIHLFRGLDV